jgi:hypothetical protein
MHGYQEAAHKSQANALYKILVAKELYVTQQESMQSFMCLPIISNRDFRIFWQSKSDLAYWFAKFGLKWSFY